MPKQTTYPCSRGQLQSAALDVESDRGSHAASLTHPLETSVKLPGLDACATLNIPIALVGRCATSRSCSPHQPACRSRADEHEQAERRRRARQGARQKMLRATVWRPASFPPWSCYPCLGGTAGVAGTAGTAGVPCTPGIARVAGTAGIALAGRTVASVLGR